MSQVLAYLNDENGASAAEYALILAIVGAGIAVAVTFLGNVIGSAVNVAGSRIAG